MIGGITFIFSNVDFTNVDLPFLISDTMILRAASETEVSKLNKHLEETYGVSYKWVKPFNQGSVEIEENDTKKTRYSENTKSRWWIIAFDGSNNEVIELAKVALLVSSKLHFGSTFIYSESDQQREQPLIIFGPHSSIEILITESRKKHSIVNNEELQKLKHYFSYIKFNDSASEHIKYVLELYSSSSSIWIHSGLLTLSLFSIIESLIAHKPRLTETLDSITHQIKNKLHLLSKRFDIELNHQEYFGEINHQNLWSKLYSLRSDIAHGQTYNFSGTNTCLKSLENTNIFLDHVVKELIKLSINEPELISDLREC